MGKGNCRALVAWRITNDIIEIYGSEFSLTDLMDSRRMRLLFEVTELDRDASDYLMFLEFFRELKKLSDIVENISSVGEDVRDSVRKEAWRGTGAYHHPDSCQCNLCVKIRSQRKPVEELAYATTE